MTSRRPDTGTPSGALPRTELTPTPDPRGEMLWESSPSRYIAKVSMTTGREIPRPIDPDDLLVHAHRDKSPIEVTAQFLASRAIQLTGNEDTVKRGLRQANRIGLRIAQALGQATGSRVVEKSARKLIGVADRDVFYRFREPTHLSDREIRARIEKLRAAARAKLKARGRNPRLHVLLTGATGFLGREILAQAADDRRMERVVSVVRRETVRDPKTKAVVKVLDAGQRGALLLQRLGIRGARARKFVFVEGDVEKPDLGIAPGTLAGLRKTLTHVVHCAASVAFDDTYENSYRANVLGSRNALAFALALQRAPGSPFVAHVAIETSYVHGRKKRTTAQENALVFPRHFYNNFYELTKAMASMETDRFLVEEGLRVVQLLPSIVIGDSKTGNNRGDTKVVNAPINAFGRSQQALDAMKGDLFSRGKAWLIGSIAGSFPGDRSAELNLVPVDRVVSGILASLTVPEAIGERIHLATDQRIRSEDIARISREELGVNVRLADPTLFRNVTLPVVTAALERLKEPKLANALKKLGTVFAGYNEWGQPIHDVGNDVRILKLPLRRPDTEHAFRMLCRHNKYVQEFGKIRDADEIARREASWAAALADVAHVTGREVASIPPDEFRRLLAERLDLSGFTLKRREKRTRGGGGGTSPAVETPVKKLPPRAASVRRRAQSSRRAR